MASPDPEKPEGLRRLSPQPDRRNSQSTQGDEADHHQQLPPSALRNVQFRSVRDNQPSIRLRRIRSGVAAEHQQQPQQTPQQQPQPQPSQSQQGQPSQDQQTGRRRSNSEPYRRWFMSDAGELAPHGADQMPSVPEA